MLKKLKEFRFAIIGIILVLLLSVLLTAGLQFVLLVVDINNQIKEKKEYLVAYIEAEEKLENQIFDDVEQEREINEQIYTALCQLGKSEQDADALATALGIGDGQTLHRTTDLWVYYDYLLGDIKLVDDAFIAIFDKETGDLLYSQDESFVDVEVREAQGIYTVKDVYIHGAAETGDIRVEIYTPISALMQKGMNRVQYQLVFFVPIILLLVAYIIFLYQSLQAGDEEVKFRRKYYPKDQSIRYLGVAIILGTFLVLMTFVAQNLSLITERFFYLQQVDGSALDERNQLYQTGVAEPQQILELGDCINAFMNDNPEFDNGQGLEQVAAAMDLKNNYGIQYISLFDERGNTYATTSPYGGLRLLEDKNSSFYEMKKVLVGRTCITITTDSDLLGVSLTMIGMPKRDSNGDIEGIIAFFYEAGRGPYDVDLDEGISFERVQNMHLKLLTMGENSYAILFDPNGDILADTDDAQMGENITSLGFDLEELDGNYQSVDTLQDKQTSLVVQKATSSGNYILAVQPFSWFNGVTISSCVKNLLVFVIIALWILDAGLGSRLSRAALETAQAESEADKAKETVDLMTNDDSVDIGLMMPDTDEDKNKNSNWDLKSAEEKLGFIVTILLYIAAALIILSYITSEQSSLNLNIGILEYIYSEAWPQGFNMFAFIADMLLILATWAVIKWSTWILQLLASFMGGRGETIFRLLSSVVKYTGVIACAYVAALNVGIDARATLASMGIAAMALGFGAKDMIADIFAGIFILFEGNYKVGDMIMMDGEWFWVRAIGIRTTKIEAWGHVKIINNSQMTGVVNLENGNAVVNVDLPISADHKISEIEEIFAQELPAIAEDYPAEVAGPFYKGVVDFDGHNVTYRIRCFTPMMWQGKVKRQLNKQMLETLERYDIRISPKVTDIKTR